MTDDTTAADLIGTLLGTPDTARNDRNRRVLRTALRLLATGDPVDPAALAAAAGITVAELDQAVAGHDIEYDDHGQIIGWGLTRNPTPHRFTVEGRVLYTWCAPDTLIFPAVLGRTAQVESPCPATGTTIRVTVDPVRGVTALEPATAVVTIVDPARVDTAAVRATLCNPQHFFATADAARDFAASHPGMLVLPVADAHRHITAPLADAIIC